MAKTATAKREETTEWPADFGPAPAEAGETEAPVGEQMTQPETAETLPAVLDHKPSHLTIIESDQAVAAALQANLGDEGVDLRDFDRVKTPAGGSTVWSIPTEDGDDDTKLFSGIILTGKMTRAYWRGEFDGGNQPPDCSSEDCKQGIGDPGGACSLCPMDVFGSAKGGEGDGKACGEAYMMIIDRIDGDGMPLVLAVKPGSFKTFKKYRLKLSLKGKKVSDVITDMTLKKAKNKRGIDFSEIQFAESKTAVPNPDEIASMAATFKALLAQQRISELTQD